MFLAFNGMVLNTDLIVAIYYWGKDGNNGQYVLRSVYAGSEISIFYRRKKDALAALAEIKKHVRAK